MLLATMALLSCRQPNPEWLGPVSAMTLASTSDDSAGSESDASTSTTDPDTTDPDTTGGPTPPDACAPEPILGDGPCPDACDACSEGRCQITCTEDTCESQTVACPEGWPCDLVCTGGDACRDADLRCPPDRDCTVDCRGPRACRDAVVDCGSMSCVTTCGPQSNACDDLLVRCGQADTQVICEGSSEVGLEARGSSCACEAIDCG